MCSSSKCLAAKHVNTTEENHPTTAEKPIVSNSLGLLQQYSSDSDSSADECDDNISTNARYSALSNKNESTEEKTKVAGPIARVSSLSDSDSDVEESNYKTSAESAAPSWCKSFIIV